MAFGFQRCTILLLDRTNPFPNVAKRRSVRDSWKMAKRAVYTLHSRLFCSVGIYDGWHRTSKGDVWSENTRKKDSSHRRGEGGLLACALHIPLVFQ